MDEMKTIYKKVDGETVSVLGDDLVKKIVDHLGMTHVTMHARRSFSSGVGAFVRLASYITDGARALLSNAVSFAGKGNVFYMDTDSVFVNDFGYQQI